MPSVADRVAETTATTGTGTVTLAGAKTGYQAFTTAFADGTKVYYCITDNTDFEVGVGTFTTAGTTLSRDSIFASSNAGSAVNWGAGTKDVFCTAPMQSIVGAPRFQNKTGAYTVVAGDNGTIINCTSGTFTVSLDAAATLGAGFNCWIWNTSAASTDAITIDPSGAETIDGRTTLILRRGEGTQIVCDSTNWQTGDKKTMRLYAENLSSTSSRPVATGNISIAIGSSATASGSSSVAFGHFVTASGSSAMAFGSGVATTSATSTESLAIGSRVTCSSSYATAIGQNSGTGGSVATSGSGAMALGGSYASGTDSFAAAVANNTASYGATGANSVAIGDRAKASSSDALCLSYGGVASGTGSIAIGTLNTASASKAVAIGDTNTASASYASAIGGLQNQATQSYSFVCGTYGSSSVINKFAYGSGFIGSLGAAQYGLVPLVAATTDATPKVLTTSNAAASTTNQVILPNNSAYAFAGTVVARQQAAGGTASAAWKIEGLIRREANAASTTLVASTVTAIDNTPGWTLALSADTTNGGLAITATGAAATNIRWVATVQTSEVTYA